VTPTAIALLARAGDLHPADLPLLRERAGCRVLVDLQTTDDGEHEIVVTTRPALGTDDVAALRLLDGHGDAHAPERNRRGQLRFRGVPDGPWRFAVDRSI
jgi:hypothetical protein